MLWLLERSAGPEIAVTFWHELRKGTDIWYSPTTRKARSRLRLVPIAGCAILTADLLRTSSTQRHKFIPWTDMTYLGRDGTTLTGYIRIHPDHITPTHCEVHTLLAGLHHSGDTAFQICNNTTAIGLVVLARSLKRRGGQLRYSNIHRVELRSLMALFNPVGAFAGDWIRAHQDSTSTMDPVLRAKQGLLSTSPFLPPGNSETTRTYLSQVQLPPGLAPSTVGMTGTQHMPLNIPAFDQYAHDTRSYLEATYPTIYLASSGWKQFPTMTTSTHDWASTITHLHAPHFHKAWFSAHWATLRQHWQSTCSTNVEHICTAGELPLLTEVNNNIRLKRHHHHAYPMGHDRRIRARRAHLTAKTLRWHSRRLSLLHPAIPPPIGYADPTLLPPRHSPAPGYHLQRLKRSVPLEPTQKQE
ncbi:hypothetical protein B5M09_012751, partial [Aphanomyces astaci]